MAFGCTRILHDRHHSGTPFGSRTTSSTCAPAANAFEVAHITLYAMSGGVTADPALTGCGLTLHAESGMVT